ncbi:MAG TPA: metallophosphoesterase [Planctomycetota bacterium]|nr:metallophosphoesterase [Planctomycetota bacterium]
MRLGVISDSHDNLVMVRKAVHYFNEEEPVDAVVHAGDYVAPFTVKELLKLKAPFCGVFGNNDGEHAGIARIAPQIVEPPLRLELGGRRIVVVHDIEKLSAEERDLAEIIICGHTHNAKVEGNAHLVVNPGELCGWLTGKCTVAAINLDTTDVEIIYLREG